MPKIVISYRRLDSQAITGRIVDKLARHYGNESIFFDIDSTPYGVDFRDYFDSIMVNSQVLLAIIGPRWVGPRRGKPPRLADANDRVRIEVESALRCGVRVIPILVDRAVMPTDRQLPDGLQDLAYLHAPTIDSGADFHPQMDRFIRRMDSFLSESTAKRGAPEALADTPASISESPALGGVAPRDGEELGGTVLGEADIDTEQRGGTLEPPRESAPPAAVPGPPEIQIASAPLLTTTVASDNSDMGAVATPSSVLGSPTATGPETPLRLPMPARRYVLITTAGLAAAVCLAAVWWGWREPSEPARQQSESTRSPNPTLASDAAKRPSERADQFRREALASPDPSRGRPTPVEERAQKPGGVIPGRLALLIGNANYRVLDSPLGHTVANARDFASELQRYGFDVQVAENLSKDASSKALERLYRGTTSGSAVVLFFSGIGLQVHRRTFLLPVDASIWTESDVAREGLDIEAILAELQVKGAAMKVAVLDASRRNPFPWGHADKGLSVVTTPPGTIVISAAEPETVIYDGDGEGNLFMRQLLKEMRAPNSTVGQIFDQTRKSVTAASQGRQIPWFSSTIAEEIPLAPDQGTASAR